ncbi:MAG: hypothetical protein JXB32_04965 [Deltaproteobacteria bacterium]|nr:hypothetical protein [Deltaproteobacteria bacterium]
MRRLPLALVLLLPSLGCPDGGFDARGTEAAVSLEWRIEGATADGAACAAVAASRARLVVHLRGGDWHDPDLEWPCDAGVVETAAVFATATLDFAVELLDAAGEVVAWSPWQRHTVAPGDNPLGTFELTGALPPPDASLDLAWTIGGAPAGAATCTGLGAESVALDWRIGAYQGPSWSWPCADGAGRVELGLRSGRELDLRLRLVDADGFTLVASPRASWYLATLEPGDNALPPFDFPTAEERGPLAVVLSWADGGSDPVLYVSCEEAGVAAFGYVLRDEAGSTVDASPADAPLACTGYFAWPALAHGRYELTVEGFEEASGGEPAWRAECWGLLVEPGAPDSYLCRVPRLP